MCIISKVTLLEEDCFWLCLILLCSINNYWSRLTIKKILKLNAYWAFTVQWLSLSTIMTVAAWVWTSCLGNPAQAPHTRVRYCQSDLCGDHGESWQITWIEFHPSANSLVIMFLSAFLSPWLIAPITAMDMVTILSKIPDAPLEPYDEVMRKNKKTNC